jgi:hypothetical protein
MKVIHAGLAVLLAGVMHACSRAPATGEMASAAAADPAQSGPPPTAVAGARPAQPVHAAFRNVHLRVDEGITLEVAHLDGSLISTDASRPPVFDDQRSFTLRVDSAEVAMTPASLTNLLNHHVFAYEQSPFTNLEVSIEGGKLKQKGTLHKGVTVPFTILADVSATSDGRIRVHPTSVKTAGIPSKGLMKLFGIELDDLVKSNRSHGVEIQDNDFLLEPTRLLSSPSLSGRLTNVRIVKDRIVETFGSGGEARTPSRPDRRARNYMYYFGGVIRFGKLTMTDTDMQLIDADPRDPFDFSPRQYIRQLVAGYSKNTPSGGLRVYMPDYDKVSAADLRPDRMLH